MKNRDTNPEENARDEIEALLPWYVSGRLEDAERERVEAQLEDGDAYREALDAARQMERAVVDEPVEWSLPEGHFERLKTQIAIEAPRREAVAETPPTVWAQWMDWLAENASLPRWSLAAQAALIVALVVVALDRPEPGPAVYETLTRATATEPGAATPAVLVAFDRDTPESELRSLLVSAGARIVEGPSPIGIYGVVPIEGGEAGALLERLRAAPIVTLAESATLLPSKAPGDAE